MSEIQQVNTSTGSETQGNFVNSQGTEPYRITRLHDWWCLTWEEEGNRRRYKLSMDYQEAVRLAPAKFAELAQPIEKPILSVNDVFKLYMTENAEKPICVTLKYTSKALRPMFGNKLPSEITVAHCREYTADRRARDLKDGTIWTELGHLRMVLRWAEKHKYIPEAPYIEKPMKPEPKEDYLTRQQIQKLLRDCPAHLSHLRLAVLLMISTGARLSAALQLKWDRIDFDREQVDLRVAGMGRRKGRAVVPMSKTLKEALSNAFVSAKEGRTEGFVIEWGGKPIRTLKRSLNLLAETTGISFTAHMLRHSAAVWLAEDGHSMHEISQFLGHSNTIITERVYARFSPAYLRKLSSSLELTD
ncbi:tyrosine-type recombinase/integrase [Phyllobacterium sophorae]|uniref:Integrase n=1 Tax=Phyllobacterium sophorae TaxID=1520277 RepID=A0A2P7BDY4_9HYPH|nr:site-specific integrase [Phyllobacterium sophorae]PSH64686.1 integrase [Phyllobacterium sophorae]